MKSWPAEWFPKTKRGGADFFVEDIKIRKFIDETFPRSGISKVVIRKTATEGEIMLFATKVGLLMGKNGDRIKEAEQKMKEKF
jgi:small subunit ribosomal protein S3